MRPEQIVWNGDRGTATELAPSTEILAHHIAGHCVYADFLTWTISRVHVVGFRYQCVVIGNYKTPSQQSSAFLEKKLRYSWAGILANARQEEARDAMQFLEVHAESWWRDDRADISVCLQGLEGTDTRPHYRINMDAQSDAAGVINTSWAAVEALAAHLELNELTSGATAHDIIAAA